MKQNSASTPEEAALPAAHLHDAGSILQLANWSKRPTSAVPFLFVAYQQSPSSASGMEGRVALPSCQALLLLETARAAVHHIVCMREVAIEQIGGSQVYVTRCMQ